MVERARKSPDQLLAELHPSGAAREGHLKIFLGYASGVGKSFRMFDEARRRVERGQDVVAGGLQPQVSAEVAAILSHIEIIPLKDTAIDVETLIARRPAVCLIDGLAYNNPPGSLHPTRWQDVTDLIAAGIKVIGSINIQYVAELREQVEAITGKKVRETVPVSFIKSADEIEVVDAPTAACTDPAQARRLSRLRELALVLAADVVDHQLNLYLEQHGIPQQIRANERILVCLTPRANAREMLESASIVAQKFHGEFIAAYVNQPGISAPDRAALEEKLNLARAAGARIEILQGEHAVDAILDFARKHGVTQIFIGHSLRTGLSAWISGNPVDSLIRRARGMDIRVFPQ